MRSIIHYTLERTLTLSALHLPPEFDPLDLPGPQIHEGNLARETEARQEDHPRHA